MKSIIILLGKSASGKDTVANYLCDKYNYNKIITWTTRKPRNNEKNGIDYYFTNKNIFTDMILHKELIEYRTYNTLFNNIPETIYYGTHKEINNIDLYKKNVLILDYQGCLSALQYFGVDKCYVVFIDCPDKIREERAKKRGSFSQEEWNRRCKDDAKNFNWNKIKGIVDKKIINVDKTVKEVCEEIIKEDK